MYHWQMPLIGAAHFFLAHCLTLVLCMRAKHSNRGTVGSSINKRMIEEDLALGLFERAAHLAGLHALVMLCLWLLLRYQPVTIWITAAHCAASYWWDTHRALQARSCTLSPAWVRISLFVFAFIELPMCVHATRVLHEASVASIRGAHLVGWILSEACSQILSTPRVDKTVHT